MTEIFDGPQLTPPRISLLTAADIVTPDDERWGRGFELFTEGCETIDAIPLCDETPSQRDGQRNGEILPYSPYVLFSSFECSTFGSGRSIDWYDRAQRKLLTGESTALEEILWTGKLGAVNLQANNQYLDNVVTTVALTANSPENAISALDQEIGELSATRGMIHVRPILLGQLLDHKVIRREGNVYLSPLDNLVVPGRGYPGTGPAQQAVGATEWMYGHPGIVQVRRGPVIRLGEDDLASQVNRYVNDRTVFVQRVSHVALDTTCTVLAIEVDSIV